ncbi:AAA family ATPase [Listeria booriae]|uniref:AAA family ATPase n=1 Tax=Listeria booriae TaxID=1552123 RepID=A0A842AWS2_9LIST|nr:AAA family ATPase [Listeria booriae]MBC1796186.1 AAA family ATPase [Listeria booriae]
MYLSSLILKNFRSFGSSYHEIKFNKGLTVLVGENDSGKSAILDAIRIVLGTTDFHWYRINEADFHEENTSLEIKIICKFTDLSSLESAAFLEYLTYEKDANGDITPSLYLHWSCRYIQSFKPPRPVTSLTTGKGGDGPVLSPESRETLRVTYLRALRDAYSDMQSGKNSRLSQVIQNVSDINKGEDDFKDDTKLSELSLIGIFNLSNKLLDEYPALQKVKEQMTDILKNQMLLDGDSLATRFEVTGSDVTDLKKLASLLEKLDLTIDRDATSLKGVPGLGTSNIMSMACELLLRRSSQDACQLLLIEEPEAHIHAQRQMKLVKSLQAASEGNSQQIILTTHSPLLASAIKLQNIILIKNGKSYPLSKDDTNLDSEDYIFLERYLDSTKANLFFARNVIIVEGPGEALLLPTISKLLNKDFIDFGVSLVDVRSTGLRRYSRIFQRKSANNPEEWLNVKVACITDRDIMPDCAPAICLNKDYKLDGTNWPKQGSRRWRAECEFNESENDEHIKKIEEKANGQLVKTFVANHWTLEYDLAYYGLTDTVMRNTLIGALVKVSYAKENWERYEKEIVKKLEDKSKIEEKASCFYSFFAKGITSKAEFAQQLALEIEKTFSGDVEKLESLLPPYIVESITYVTKE